MHRNKANSSMRKGSASSGRMRMLGSERKSPHLPGRAPVKKVTLLRQAVDEYRRSGERALRARLNDMDAGDREGLERLQSLAEDNNFDAGSDAPNMVDVEDVMAGGERAELSHAGGEFVSLEQEIEEDSGDDNDAKKARKAKDWRTRRDLTERRNRAFDSQMSDMLSAYIRMCAEPEMPAQPRGDDDAEVEELYEIQVVDIFGTSSVEVKLDPQANGVVPALILAQMIPSAPWAPTVAIKLRVLEAYRVPYRPYLCQQFSVAYDLYLDLRRRTDERVMKALGRDSTWRLKHACPACTYKLEGEDALIFEMLTTMDGNDSLKRVLRREKATMAECEMEEPVLGKSRERVDNRDAGDGYYISRERVERWARDRLADRLPMQPEKIGGDNPCADRWKNMINDVTSKMWGIFDETGVFLALCRHGFVLVIADMIRSGELAKYPLAVVKDGFGMKIGAGYDVGCHFEGTVANSELGEEAQKKGLRCLVGSFHGHAHNRLCQLRFLATYVEGMGLEDLEGCERFFSRSNGLAKSCRYASRFHRQQEIATYVKHFDTFETYANLSKFLCSNYHQALAILETEAPLRAWMRLEGVDSFDRFHEWLVEERTYLEGLKNSPKTNDDTLEMEYVQRLVNLSASQAKYKVVAAEARRAKGDDGTYTPGVSKVELARRHAQEKMEKDLDRVHELETTLDIVERWTTESPEWTLTVNKIKKRKYHLALDALELLIVERIFELTKMNRSETGYKMRKHIAKALQARSKAVKNAIERYNDAAAALEPPMPSVSWEQVVEYAFLADFDILRDTRSEVQSKPWARPSYRLAMDRYFKILRAREEIKRLNIEIRRVVTWIRDENRFLRRMEKNLREVGDKSEEKIEEDVQMAVQVRLYRERRGRFDAGHLERFCKLAKTAGFTGSLQSGMAVERQEAEQRLRELQAELAGEGEGDKMEVDDEEEPEVSNQRNTHEEEIEEEDEGHEAREEMVSDLLYQISMLAVDDHVLERPDDE
ncbi:hypothetical protein MSAN_01502300 [Mycena sanguinolenta]|uniref:CxC1-like cysteine cluster associated with KDZ transposases domain-containing protein n=1 Tax=Mycena sanguinolenta TaxID=230812 RepID=A0A8H6Y2Y9_9AGAR|nr:hypothetical protein MSAN_01502300 [Mycena sanguinolenta]